jgi:hypothetical protein
MKVRDNKNFKVRVMLKGSKVLSTGKGPILNFKADFYVAFKIIA